MPHNELPATEIGQDDGVERMFSSWLRKYDLAPGPAPLTYDGLRESVIRLSPEAEAMWLRWLNKARMCLPADPVTGELTVDDFSREEIAELRENWLDGWSEDSAAQAKLNARAHAANVSV